MLIGVESSSNTTMRYSNPAQDPDARESRSRSTIMPTGGDTPNQFGQRPMFSVPGPDQPPPDQGMIGREAQLDPVIPTDESEGSKSRAVLEFPNAREGTTHTYSINNVSSPPTEAQIEAAFGPRPAGWIGLIIDGGSAGAVWLCVKSKSNLWWYEALTKAT